MGASKSSTKEKSGIHCIEVLISKNHVGDYHDNIFWTLSVYSLENQPVKKNRDVNDFEIYHFMVYDWRRTIKQLLDDRQIPYSIIQQFSTATVYPETTSIEVQVTDNETAFVKALGSLAASERHGSAVDKLFAGASSGAKADLMPM